MTLEALLASIDPSRGFLDTQLAAVYALAEALGLARADVDAARAAA